MNRTAEYVRRCFVNARRNGESPEHIVLESSAGALTMNGAPFLIAHVNGQVLSMPALLWSGETL